MSLALRHRASLLGAALLLALAAGAAPPAPPPLSLEQLYRVQPWRGEPAKEPAFSRSGRYLAYLWNAHGEPGSDLHLHDIKTGKTLRLSSPQIMAGFDSPEELKRFDDKRAQRDREWTEAQAAAEAQQAYLRGERVDLGRWEREALARLREEAAAKRLKDEAQKTADKLEAEAEKRAMVELAARRAGKALSPSAAASAPADKPAAAEPQKEDWEWRDELKKQLAKHKLKATDLYPGVTQIVWAHERDELIFQYRGHLFRWQAANGERIEPLLQTQRPLRALAYTRDDLGFVYLDEGRLLRQRFAGGAVQLLNRELFNPDDADRKYKIEASSLSEDGRWMALTARAPQEPGEDGKPAPKPGRQVEIMDYAKRFATAKKVDREVSDDKRIQPPTAIYIRPVPQGAEPPAKQPEPVFTHKGGDVWFELTPVALSRDGSRYAFATWEREKELLRVYLGKSGEAKPELVLERRGDVGHEVVNVLRPQFTPDGQTLVLTLDEAGWRQPHGIDVTSKALRPLVKGEFEAHQVLGFSLDSKAMFVLANKDDLAAMNLYRVELASGAMTALGQSPDYHRNAAVSKDGRLAAAVAGHWGSRPELKLLQPGQAPKVLTASHDPQVAQIDRLRPERFSFKNRHGDSLQAYLFKPPGWQASDRRPAIVYVYGGPLERPPYRRDRQLPGHRLSVQPVHGADPRLCDGEHRHPRPQQLRPPLQRRELGTARPAADRGPRRPAPGTRQALGRRRRARGPEWLELRRLPDPVHDVHAARAVRRRHCRCRPHRMGELQQLVQRPHDRQGRSQQAELAQALAAAAGARAEEAAAAGARHDGSERALPGHGERLPRAAGIGQGGLGRAIPRPRWRACDGRRGEAGRLAPQIRGLLVEGAGPGATLTQRNATFSGLGTIL